ncbi:MAG: hypothetical protein GTO03_11940 [Planctomycetales bacterium]|nr:hypothetical protein [Planctomycetales bacterium]
MNRLLLCICLALLGGLSGCAPCDPWYPHGPVIGGAGCAGCGPVRAGSVLGGPPLPGRLVPRSATPPAEASSW